MIGLAGIAIMLFLIFTRMWVGFSMMLVGIIGCGLLSSWTSVFSMAGTFGYSKMADYSMSCIPLFIFMGSILYQTGLGTDIYVAVRVWLSRIRGGLAMATVTACGIFAAICGDSVATAVTLGKVAYPEMMKYKYGDKLASCSVTAGGTLGILIPPSIPFIIYGAITETSIGKLFIAGIIPGITQLLFYIITILVWSKMEPGIAPKAFSTSMKEKLKSTKPILPILVILAVMIGGLYGGLFTPTEAGAFSAASVMVVALCIGRLNKETLFNSVKDGMATACMVFFLVLGAYFFTRFMILTDLPEYLSGTIIAVKDTYSIPVTGIIILIVVFYIFIGCFLDILAALLLTIPIIFPIITSLGLDPIWWGVIMVRVMEIGMITPPFGLNLFAMSKTVEIPIGKLYRGVWPFLVADVCHVLLLVLVPSLSLWLPANM